MKAAWDAVALTGHLRPSASASTAWRFASQLPLLFLLRFSAPPCFPSQSQLPQGSHEERPVTTPPAVWKPGLAHAATSPWSPLAAAGPPKAAGAAPAVGAHARGAAVRVGCRAEGAAAAAAGAQGWVRGVGVGGRWGHQSPSKGPRVSSGHSMLFSWWPRVGELVDVCVEFRLG